MHLKSFAMACLIAWFCPISPSLAADVRPSIRVYHVGVLANSSPEQLAEPMDALKSALRELGWKDDRLKFTERWANRHREKLPTLANELVEIPVDVIVAFGTSSVEAAARATRTIPIVFPLGWDPVGDKLVQSLGRPGGNVTGLSTMAPDLYAKELALLKEALPALRRVGVLTDAENPNGAEIVRAMRAASAKLDVDIRTVDIRPLETLDERLRKIADDGAQALTGFVNFPDVLEKCIAFGLSRHIVLAGYTDRPPGLLSLEVDEIEITRRAAGYVDKVLRGARPSDLPVEQPTRFKLIVNVRTASEFKLVVPNSLLLRADEVIR